MGRADLPDYKQKQKLLHSTDTSKQVLTSMGERFFSEGWYSDAIDFFERAEHAEGLDRIRRQAQEEGDPFLLTRCLKAQNDQADDREWQGLAARAEALGKLQFAREGYRKAGDRRAMDKVDAMIIPPADGPADGAQEEPA